MYLQLRRFLGEETSGEQMLLSHRRDIVRNLAWPRTRSPSDCCLQLFDEHFATLNQSEEGRNKSRTIADFLNNKLELIWGPSKPSAVNHGNAGEAPDEAPAEDSEAAGASRAQREKLQDSTDIARPALCPSGSVSSLLSYQ